MSEESSVGDTLTALVVLHADPELDPETGERMARRLRTEISELDLDAVTPVPAGPPPEGAKGADPVTVGAIVLAFSASGGVFTALVETLRDWLGRQSGRNRISVTIDGDTIELDRASAAQQQQLLDAYVRRHSGG